MPDDARAYSPSPASATTYWQLINPYNHDRMVEQLLVNIGATYEQPSMASRSINAAGADSANDLKKGHNPETQLIPPQADDHSAPDAPASETSST